MPVPLSRCPICDEQVVETRVIRSGSPGSPPGNWWGTEGERAVKCLDGIYCHFTDGRRDKLALLITRSEIEWVKKNWQKGSRQTSGM